MVLICVPIVSKACSTTTLDPYTDQDETNNQWMAKKEKEFDKRNQASAGNIFLKKIILDFLFIEDCKSLCNT